MNAHDDVDATEPSTKKTETNIKKLVTEKILAILQYEDNYRQSLIVRKGLYRNIINVDHEEYELVASEKLSSLIRELFKDHVDLSQTFRYTSEELSRYKRLLDS